MIAMIKLCAGVLLIFSMAYLIINNILHLSRHKVIYEAINNVCCVVYDTRITNKPKPEFLEVENSKTFVIGHTTTGSKKNSW